MSARCCTWLGLLAGGVVIATASQAGAGVMNFSSDTDFITFQNSGGFTKTFGGNVRWGDALPVGDWEYAIVNGSDVPIGGAANSPWAGSNSHSVTFSYDGAGASTLALGSIGSLTRAVPADPTVIFARVRDSATPFSFLSSIAIDLAFNGPGVDYSYSLLTGDNDAEYWGVSDANLRFGYTLTAQASLDGPRTSGSNPMYQFKVGVPSPGAASLLALGAAAALGRRRR